jgi:hypothetical protein
LAIPKSAKHVRAEASEQLGPVIHQIMNATSVLALNVQHLIEKGAACGDETLLADTRSTLERLVKLAREVQRIQALNEGPPNARDSARESGHR